MLDKFATRFGWPPMRVALLGWVLAAVLVLGALSLLLNGAPIIVGVLVFVLGAFVTVNVGQYLMRIREAKRGGESAEHHPSG